MCADIGIPTAPDKTVQQTSASQLPQTKLYNRHQHPNCPRQNCTTDISIPTAPDKTVQPTQVITFLGLELDSVAMEVRLPVDKLNRCTALTETCLKKDKTQLNPPPPPVRHWHTVFRMWGGGSWKTLFKKSDQFDYRGDTSLSLHSHHTRSQRRSEDLVNIPTSV